ncbi:PREDICTED: uncharacterized protein LOC108752631 isoform X1 [Trachymyrmex septentrionalis]|uniref:uncharacterized protein LOC108752631 isoform X1 n=2 Tax=Trachymyrmex septentrionalis TaxID=34720 RepID=UPI00084F12B1|nr:PREDICTED: uncharacterized protein LOC108752631 isoform X1 [Trachymyrmex septentrionalis]
MGSEADVEAASTNAVDSDGSVSWEDFFGTSTDLVPQLLGMFDELARRSDGYDGDHVVLPSSCSISAVLQKRLSMVPVAQRSSVFGQFCTNGDLARPVYQDMLKTKEQEGEYNEVVADTSNNTMLETIIPVVTVEHEGNGEIIGESTGKPMYERRETNGLTTPLRYNKRRRNGRPLSGSSIASSTSSSSCSNQGNTSAANPYLASVESLADTCASSQGSADSGVVTVSKGSCRILNDDNEQRRNSAEEDPLCHGPRYCDPHRNPVERVLLEIVDTEAIYVEHLRQVIQGYLIFWRDNPPSFSRRLRLGDLFSNIEDIFEFNREFLWEIEKCGLDPVCVANTFIKRNSGFKVYTEYCTNYPRTVSVLTDLMGQEETASSFRERQKALSHQLPLGSFLLKPVQRILKYHLLLENLSKEYGADCDSRENEAEGRSAIEAALAAMTGIAKHINAMKRRHEHAVRVQEIQSLLYGWLGPDLTTSGELVAEGRFRMRGAKAPRHAFLFDRMLLLTKKKEDGLLVYKAHIMCSNLMLIESIPGEPLSFHVIPFDNPRLQYTLQARNLEQKREWTLQIKRVILENYNAVIPSHARQLVLQLGQTQQEADDALTDKGSAKKHSAPPEYLEKRKQERERRRSETSLKQKFMRGVRRSDTTMEDSPTSSCKNDNEDINDSREPTFNRSSDARASKVRDRFTGWRRKSEPGFQSYVCLNHLDEEQKETTTNDAQSTMVEVAEEATEICTEGICKEENQTTLNSLPSAEAKDNNEQHAKPAQTVEEIVSHILMQNQEFQKLLEKQQTNSIINVRQQRFNKRISADTSDESDSENANYVTSSISHNNSNNRLGRARALHRERLIRTNNAWNLLSSVPARENQQPLQLLYDNLKTIQKSTETLAHNGKTNQLYERQAFKRQSIVTESKVIKTALRIRENSTSTGNEETVISPAKCMLNHRTVERKEINSVVMTERIEKDGSERCNDERSDANDARDAESKGFGNYDNLQHVWEGLQTVKGDADGNDSPTQPAVWLTKLCEGLPTSPPKSGSLPRSFQISPNSQPTSVTKSRFLQRDGKPMSERPFTIASDKPAEINLEDMERYASTCQPEGRIAKFPMPTVSTSSSTSTFFCSLEDTRLTDDTYSDVQSISASDSANIHPDHKIYRANGNSSGSTIFRSVFKAGSRLQGRLRNTMSTETLECNDEVERTRYFRSLSSGGKYPKKRTKQTKQHAREPSSDVEELMGCSNDQRIPQLYYKQGSSSLGARIAQSDYADPTILFAESKRAQSSSIDINQYKNTAESERRDCEEETGSNKDTEHHESETDSFYEKSFETIENYADVDEAFRDSAIFSDVDETFVMRQSTPATTTKMTTMETAAAIAKAKIAPPVPAKKKQEMSSIKPNVAQKPDYLKIKSLLARGHPAGNSETRVTTRLVNVTHQPLDSSSNNYKRNIEMDRDDVSAGQSQAGWVRKIVGQLQGHVET